MAEQHLVLFRKEDFTLKTSEIKRKGENNGHWDGDRAVKPVAVVSFHFHVI